MYEPLKERMNNGAKAQQPPKATAVAAAAPRPRGRAQLMESTTSVVLVEARAAARRAN